MKAIIVAGGKGQRLRPLTNNLPKPMIEVSGKPILWHTINLLKRHGITDLIISLCYMPEKITNYFGNGKKFGVSIKYIYENENTPLGTAGNIAEARKFISSPFIVTYADIIRELNITDMIGFHSDKKALATLHIYKRFGQNPKSAIVFNKNKKIINFIERPSTPRHSREGGNPDIQKIDFVWSNASFYIFEPGIFDFIPANTASDFGLDIFPKLLLNNKKMYAYLSSGFFIDIGDLQKLELAKKILKPNVNSN